ncbi:SH2 domain-containing protein 2A-like isoform X2 [Ptychodera flava]|uniref:SH2 domain-containing protein 2A-like isoform X2 n=1 Tax=Ptychodera flava TaxID=63121 RepID=UPI00396A6E03
MSRSFEDELSCPICFSIYNDPRLLPCAHNFCRSCLHDLLKNKREKKNILVCPICRQTFLFKNSNEIDDLKKNFTLIAVLERLQRGGGQLGGRERFPPAVCTICQMPSEFSCFKCQASYCQTCQQSYHIRSCTGATSYPNRTANLQRIPGPDSNPVQITTGERTGFASSNVKDTGAFGGCATNLESDVVLQQSPWFHGAISRKEAEDLLKGKPRGSYLIRVSESRPGFSLTTRTRKRCLHYMIDQKSNGKYEIVGENEQHNSLEALILFHQQPLPQCDLLTSPCYRSNVCDGNRNILDSPEHGQISQRPPSLPPKQNAKCSGLPIDESRSGVGKHDRGAPPPLPPRKAR